MRNILHFLGSSLLLFAISFGSLSAQKTVMFVGNGQTIPTTLGTDTRDSLYVVKLKAAGWNVIVINDNQTKAVAPEVAAALAASNAVVVSSTVAGGDVLASPEILASGLPILAWEAAIWDEMGLCGGNNGVSRQDTLVNLDLLAADPNMVGLLSEKVQFMTSILLPGSGYSSPTGTLAAGAVIAGTCNSGDSTRMSYVYVPAGGTLTNGTAVGMRIAWGLFSNDSQFNVTNVGWQLFLRAVSTMLGEVYSATVGTPANFAGKSSFWYANNSLYLNLEGAAMKSDIKIFDVTGKLMLQKQVQGDSNVTIPMNNFKSGLYIVRGSDFSGKFIK